jgi:hypothetical protein
MLYTCELNRNMLYPTVYAEYSKLGYYDCSMNGLNTLYVKHVVV